MTASTPLPPAGPGRRGDVRGGEEFWWGCPAAGRAPLFPHPYPPKHWVIGVLIAMLFTPGGGGIPQFLAEMHK